MPAGPKSIRSHPSATVTADHLCRLQCIGNKTAHHLPTCGEPQVCAAPQVHQRRLSFLRTYVSPPMECQFITSLLEFLSVLTLHLVRVFLTINGHLLVVPSLFLVVLLRYDSCQSDRLTLSFHLLELERARASSFPHAASPVCAAR